jgi:hypothetical protein
MTSSTPGVLGRRRNSFSGAAGGGVAGKKGQNDPVDDFVSMESELAGELCSLVDSALNALKKVCLISIICTKLHHEENFISSFILRVISILTVYSTGAFRFWFAHTSDSGCCYCAAVRRRAH